jgi:hypothetical protein
MALYDPDDRRQERTARRSAQGCFRRLTRLADGLARINLALDARSGAGRTNHLATASAIEGSMADGGVAAREAVTIPCALTAVSILLDFAI